MSFHPLRYQPGHEHIAVDEAEAASPRLEDGMAFDPWNCLRAHRPLGAINRRARR